LNRRDGDGFIVAREKDWVFIDWADLDKEGAVCAEQMLLCRALETAAHCAEVVLGLDNLEYRSAAEQLRVKIDEKFWREDRCAYIDSFASGRNNVTRHTNLLAIQLGFADEERKKAIVDSVISSDSIPAIKTPYFKFYEQAALCATGQTKKALNDMLAYWGGMLNLGATTFWEEYDPLKKGEEHLTMYGGKYDKSLCHAWGASPIYLLGKYFLGVRPTSDGYATFECVPDLAGLEWMEGIVPIEGGSVQISFRDGRLKVLASRDGGIVVWKGEPFPLLANQQLVIQT
jgi:alpha-L-rhamnosidase